MTLIISTVGTSLITNLFTTKRDNQPVLSEPYRPLLNAHANAWGNIPALHPVFATVDAHYDAEPAQLANCAEIAPLTLYAQRMPSQPATSYLFLATQTTQGEYCAQKLTQFVANTYRVEAQFLTVPFLHVGDPSHLNAGWNNLRDTLNALHAIHPNVVYNVTGGYKLISSLVTTYATTHGSRVIYTFDGSGVLTVIDVNVRGALPHMHVDVEFWR